MREIERSVEEVEAFNKELPATLRHLADKIEEGLGLREAMHSVSEGDYGAVSEEFKRGEQDIERGATIEAALEIMDIRISSPSFKRAKRFTVSSLRTGGDLPCALRMIAADVEHELALEETGVEPNAGIVDLNILRTL